MRKCTGWCEVNLVNQNARWNNKIWQSSVETNGTIIIAIILQQQSKAQYEHCDSRTFQTLFTHSHTSDVTETCGNWPAHNYLSLTDNSEWRSVCAAKIYVPDI